MKKRFVKASQRARTWKGEEVWKQIVSDVSKLKPGETYIYEGKDGTPNSIRQGISRRRKEIQKAAPGIVLRMSVVKGKLQIRVTSDLTGRSSRRFKKVNGEPRRVGRKAQAGGGRDAEVGGVVLPG